MLVQPFYVCCPLFYSSTVLSVEEGAIAFCAVFSWCSNLGSREGASGNDFTKTGPLLVLDWPTSRYVDDELRLGLGREIFTAGHDVQD